MIDRRLLVSASVLFAFGVASGCAGAAPGPDGTGGGGGTGSTTGSAPDAPGTGTSAPPSSPPSSPTPAVDAGATTADAGSLTPTPPSGGTDAGPGGGGKNDSGAPASGDCSNPNLVWHTANKTNFTSYPDPGSVECIKYNGCAYEGMFAACSQTEPLSWVQSHNIVSVFPNLNKASGGIPALALHDLCLKKGSSTILVTAIDECADSDCSGCCTQNRGSAEELIDVESFTDARWGVDDGPIEWADMGDTKGSGCN